MTYTDPTSETLDLIHHDRPERHYFGHALGMPIAPPVGSSVPSAGISDTPAREDHVHGGPNITNLATLLTAASIPVSGTTTLGTITIPSANINRIVLVSAMCLFGSPATAATAYQLSITPTGFTGGSTYFARTSAGNLSTATINTIPFYLLAGNTGVFTAGGSYIGGTSAASNVAADARYNRMDAIIFPYT